MAKIKPFNAIIYNPEKINGLSGVVCPPYDVISPQNQERYHTINPYNFIHILLSKDSPEQDKYQRAESYFKDWLKNKILIQDEKPAIYFYSQQYTIKGEKKTRFGFISLLHLGDKTASVLRHEHTRAEPKEDRLRLLKKVKANLSPIFALFLDKKRIIQRILLEYIKGKEPFVDVIDDEKINHKLWRVDARDTLDKIEDYMKDENIFLADGHHRYEVACAFRDEMKRKSGALTGEEDFNYILAYFTNMDPRGLTILPIHRLVNLGLRPDRETSMLDLKNYFHIEQVKEKHKFFFLMEKAGRIEHVLGMYADKKYWLLRLKNIKILDKLISDRIPEFRSLDVSILNYLILKSILKLDLDDKQNITFSPHPEELIARVNSDSSYIAFFLNPVKIEQIISISLNNEKMPTKSTYFYPKVLSGLVINKFDRLQRIN